MRYETLALVREMHSASVPSSIYSSASVVCVCVCAYVRVHTHTYLDVHKHMSILYTSRERKGVTEGAHRLS